MSTKGKRRERAAAREAKAYHGREVIYLGADKRGVRTIDEARSRETDWWRYDEHPRKKEDR